MLGSLVDWAPTLIDFHIKRGGIVRASVPHRLESTSSVPTNAGHYDWRGF